MSGRWVFFTFFKLYKQYQIAQRNTDKTSARMINTIVYGMCILLIGIREPLQFINDTKYFWLKLTLCSPPRQIIWYHFQQKALCSWKQILKSRPEYIVDNIYHFSKENIFACYFILSFVPEFGLFALYNNTKLSSYILCHAMLDSYAPDAFKLYWRIIKL